MERPTRKSVQPFLERLLADIDPVEARDRDPVGIVREYDRPADQEVAALVASCLAYGRVDLLRPAIRRALRPLGPEPARTLRDGVGAIEADLRDFSYRMTKGPDLTDLYVSVGELLRTYDSLETVYLSGDPDESNHRERASGFVGRLRSNRRRDELTRGFRYLLPDPADGSACKRLHLFFRWVVRGPDRIDLGLWDRVDASELLVPLDTHTSRICRYIGLTDRKSVDSVMVREVTEALRELDPEDPVRYDFAICQLGIAEDCIHERSAEHCPSCPIEPVCRL